MTGKRDVEIVEVGPRDGLQSESAQLSTASKVEFISRAIGAGLRRIEVASFVNPKKVPQMADAEAVLKALPRTDGVFYVGLVLNRRGFERAAAAGCNEIGMAVMASDTFNRRNQGVSTEDSIAAWLDIAAAARVAVGDPHDIALADTIGVGVPARVAELLASVSESVPGIRLRCHFHNTRNTGLANAYAAVQAGVVTLDASLGGIGGCPFAPAATGNIPTEDLVYMLQRCGFETGVALDAAIATSKWLQQVLGHPVPGMLVKAGNFPGPSARNG
jgi:hydroxymethylglutaryl-CoA lyase